MSLSQNSFDENVKYITPSEIIEFLYCNRFTYFMNVLGIPQNEGRRYLVELGRDKHELKSNTKPKYLSKKLGVIRKEQEVTLDSQKLKLRGKMDELLYLNTGAMVPLDYKFSEYDGKVHDTHKAQLTIYALLIEDVYKLQVEKGYLVYCADGVEIIEVILTQKDKSKLLKTLDKYKSVLRGVYPKGASSKNKCSDCTYRNYCTK